MSEAVGEVEASPIPLQEKHKMEEKILAVFKVTPPPLASADEICLPLSIFDLPLLRMPPLEMLLFYETHHPEPVFTGSILPRLKHSLSLTLRYFLPLAGNLTWQSSSSHPVILYKEGDGVLLTLAVTDVDFHHLSGKNICECTAFRPLVARLIGSHFQVPSLALKVTLFPNKGFCIGVTVHHGVVDATSVAMFMKSWASICKFGENKLLSPELTPVFDRKSVREQHEEIERLYIQFLERNGFAQNSLALGESEPPPDRVRGTFKLSKLNLRMLKEQFFYVSTFTITLAYTILCFVESKGLTSNNRVLVGFTADIRHRLKPQLPVNYFGNCVAMCMALLDRDELLKKDGMAVTVKSISENIQGLNDGGAIKIIEQWLSNEIEGKNTEDSEVMKLFVVSSSRSGFQDIDFGWGKPRKADITSADKLQAVTFTEDGVGGIDVELSLNKHEMDRFSNAFTQESRAWQDDKT